MFRTINLTSLNLSAFVHMQAGVWRQTRASQRNVNVKHIKHFLKAKRVKH